MATDTDLRNEYKNNYNIKTMSGSYRGFDDDDERRNDSSCRRGTTEDDANGASSADEVDSSYQLRVESDAYATSSKVSSSHSSGGNRNSSSARSIRSISKDIIRTFQTTIQNNSRSQIFMPENAPVSPMLQPRLQKLASETRRIVQSVQHNAIVEGVSDTLVNVNDRLGLLMRSKSTGSVATTTTNNHSNIDRGIYSSQSMRSWGSTVTAEISTFTSQKVVPLFQRQNTYPFATGGAGNPKEHNVSFDYQLMKDNE